LLRCFAGSARVERIAVDRASDQTGLHGVRQSVGPVRSAQTVVDVLSAQGVQYVFGVPGAKIDAVYDALVHDGPQGAPSWWCAATSKTRRSCGGGRSPHRYTGRRARNVGSRHGQPGDRPADANTEQDPVVALCGAVGRMDRLKRTHQSMDAAAMLKTVTKYTAEVSDPDNVAEPSSAHPRRGQRAPRGGRVVLPADVLSAPTAACITARMPVPALAAAPTAAINRARELIRARSAGAPRGLRAPTRTVAGPSSLSPQQGCPSSKLSRPPA